MKLFAPQAAFEPIRKLRRAVAVAGALAAVVAVGTVTASPASAAGTAVQKSHWTTVTSTFNLRDDDSTIFGSSYAYASSTESLGVTTVPYYQNSNHGKVFASACAGGEVRASMQMFTEIVHTSSLMIKVTLDPALYEGTNCYTTDLDGFTHGITFYMEPGQTKTGSVTLYNTDEGGGDRVIINYTVKDTVFGDPVPAP
jgi:hypothetical protein